MSSETAVSIKNVSKIYQVYDLPRHRLLQMLFRGGRTFYREFWAVRNVSLEINKGETVGIIGRNGSGKSTLLQMICGTLAQTNGLIRTHGRIAALLELGSGFNPEFTGRENIFLNGAVLGLSRKEISTNFDDIVKFADIGDFLDQPVKVYSTGMFVRLAFSVIAHVNPDILVIDEALAVGDAVFTQKCMRFLRQFKNRGTLIFVSHDMSSVLNLCDTAVWLNEGCIVKAGNAKEISEHYLQYTLQEVYGQEIMLADNASSMGATETETSRCSEERNSISLPMYTCPTSELHVSENLANARGWKTGAGEIVKVQLDIVNGMEKPVLKGGEQVRLVIRAVAHQSLERPILGFLVRDRLGQDLFGENTLPFTNNNPFHVRAGCIFEGQFIFRIPMLPNGEYSVMASLAEGDLHSNIQHHWLHDALIITVASSSIRWGLVGIPFQNVQLKVVS